ncbi:uncharacterized protein [Eurosta solidaginis]|uniref:uncharacterized protein n=1 Tax=Eurosta solidaginis TaxID=178769 RepID=UPI0035314375
MDLKSTYTSQIFELLFSFFMLPKIPFIKQQWLEACEVREETFPKCPYVWSEHFAPTDISNSGNKIVLLKSAVPRNERQDCGEVFEQEEYLDEYIEFMEGQNKTTTCDATNGISWKVKGKYNTSISTQTG